MWLLLSTAFAADPIAGAIQALGTLPEDWAVNVTSCAVSPAPRVGWRYRPYAVLRPPDGEPWVCTLESGRALCAVRPPEPCRANVLALRTTGTPRPTLDGLFGVGLGGLPEVSELLLMREQENWRFVHRAGPPTVSAPIVPPSCEFGGTEFASVPILDLAPVFGRPAWGFVTVCGSEGMGNNASGSYAYTLVTVSVGPSGPVAAGQVPLGGYGFWRSVGEQGFSMGNEHDVRCAVVRGRRLALYRSCPAYGDPRYGFPDYASVCLPSCFVGKSPVRTFGGRDGVLSPPP
jgi:hypothetical protein